MKTAILLFVVIFGCMAPTYSQINLHRKTDATHEPFQNKSIDDFGNYNFDKFNGFLSDRAPDIFDIKPKRLAPRRPAPSQYTEQRYSRNTMPCVHPKSGDRMPCLKPTGAFPMRVFKPKDVIWGILW
jgi:hypothetical protein